MCGNLYEETLFRGFLQGHCEEQALGRIRSAVISGAAFALGHVFLAGTVTGAGIPLLAFTAWEGMILALLRMRRGVLPAALAHGLAIWALAAGLV